MKACLALIPAGLLLFGFLSAPLHAEDTAAAASAPSKFMAASAHATGTITAIDAATRTVTIKGDRGRIFDIVADDRVRNFDQLHVGDLVGVVYQRSIALTLQKGGGKARTVMSTMASSTAEVGEKPGGSEVRQHTVVCDVLAVNKKAHTITLKGPQGHVIDAAVEDPEVMKVVKKGDQIVAVVTEAIAISVTPAATKGQ